MYYLFNKIGHLLLAKMQIHLQVSNVEAKKRLQKEKESNLYANCLLQNPNSGNKDYSLNLLTLFCRKVYSLYSYA
jgi:hypothetical protein